MRLLEPWVHNPVAAALGWTLIHSLWEGAIIATAFAGVLIATRSARVRYQAGCAAMLLLLSGFFITFACAAPGNVHPAAPLRPPQSLMPGAGSGAGPDSGWDPGISAIAPWLVPYWIFGVWVFGLRNLAGWISVQRLRTRGVCCAREPWQRELTKLSARLRISRPVQLLESCLTDVPVVLGHFRPVILMPVGVLTGLPAQQIEAILLHELAHVRRCDYLVNILQRWAECLLFYHPALWWISRCVREERENCCDDVVVRMKGNAREYAFALAALEESRNPRYKPAVAATGGSVMKRIRRLLDPKRPSGASAPVFAVLLFCATGTLGIAAWSGRTQDSSSAAQQETSHLAGSPYEKWLNEDVVYIIDNAERSAFLKLKTDEEREKFVEQFWARRDPTPGTPENEFKEEHYRRIAFANKHFGSSVPGWRTDRGYMYIVYGPPDEIDSHPAGSPGARSGHEEWMYRHVEGVGDNLYLTFVDRSGHGDYHLAPGNAR